jgi:UDP-N-acetylmuramyl pentapeptide synthase
MKPVVLLKKTGFLLKSYAAPRQRAHHDSSYNSSAQPLLTFAVLTKIPAQRKLALLGDMRELGSIAKNTSHSYCSYQDT